MARHLGCMASNIRHSLWAVHQVPSPSLTPSVLTNPRPRLTDTRLKASILDRAGVPLLHLAAQIRRRSPWVVAERIANGILRNKDQELVVGHVQTELTSDVIVILGGLVTGTAGTVEGRARVDARSGNVTAVLAREGIASPAGGCWVGQGNGGCGEDGSQGSELHFGGWGLCDKRLDQD